MFKGINSISSLVRRHLRIVVVSAVGVLLLGAIGYASIPGADGVIYGCYKKSGGSLRVIDRAVTNCSKDETLISWSQTGPQGPQGPQGVPGPQGPTGPQGPAGPPAWDADCNTGLAPGDEMVRVGSVCIDKYEASIWDAPVGGNQITGAIPCNPNGQDCTNIYARSVAGVAPRASITWFQAQQALVNSGKRLPTNAEWQAAAAGTPGAASCNIGPGGSVENTGANSGCISRFQANDMVGNVAEWVADWVPRSTGCTSWGNFSNNGMCLSGASTTAPGPGAMVRGGEFTFTQTAEAGVFDVYAQHPPYVSLEVIGFRGAR